MKLTREQLISIISEELEAVLSEGDDRCTRIAKRKYDVWPSAYASGAVVRCRKGEIWKDIKEDSLEEEVTPDEEEELEKIKDELKGASKMHKSQSDRIKKITANEGKKNCGCGQDPCKTYGIQEQVVNEEELEEKKKKPCKPSKGKRFAKRVNGKCRSFGQKGKAKDGGDRIRPGTKKGDAYCARSAKIKKCKNPPCANDLSRKKWKCRGSKSMKEEKNT